MKNNNLSCCYTSVNCLLPNVLRRTCAVIVSLFLFACDSDKPDVDVPVAVDTHLLDQGWSKQKAAQYHHMSFGSQLIPVDWALALKTEDGNAFFSNDNLSRLGFIEELKSSLNPYGLPVGFTVEQSEPQSWLGLGCAACHTGEIDYQGQKIRIEGGQAMVNFTLFEQELTQALETTLKNEKRWQDFLAQLQADDGAAEKIKQQLTERVNYLQQRLAMNQTDVDYGYGRLDAFGQIFNTVGVELLGLQDNRLSPDAPVSYPVLWSASHLDLVQWNGSAPNTDPGPLMQNITTAIAVYGRLDMNSKGLPVGYDSSVNFENLTTLQNWLYELKSPQWPEDLLGQLDTNKLKLGQAVYDNNCLSCHARAKRDDAKQKLKATLTPVKDVGTDPKMVENFLNAKVNSGSLKGKKVLWLAGDKIQSQERSINLVAHVAAGAALRHPLQTIKAAIKDYHSVYSATLDQNPDYYKARPLNGIWSSAPYLHNGSVLTLKELLSSPEHRRETFYVGDRTFDVERVGLISSKGSDRSLFDTRLPGNSRDGHLYGTELTETQKDALLEYLKSL